MSLKTLEEIKASVSIKEYVKGQAEVLELAIANKGLSGLSVEQTQSLSPTGTDILAATLMSMASNAIALHKLDSRLSMSQ